MDQLTNPVADNGPQVVDPAYKRLRLRQNLANVQQQLGPANRTLSTVVHQPLVSTVSEVAARTIGRPAGLLGGGLTALVGSLIYMYAVWQAGSNYSFTLPVVLFAGGFALGVVAELLAYWLRRRSV